MHSIEAILPAPEVESLLSTFHNSSDRFTNRRSLNGTVNVQLDPGVASLRPKVRLGRAQNNYFVGIAVDYNVRIVGREYELSFRFRCAYQVNDFHHYSVVQIVFWLIYNQRASRLV